MQKKFALFAVLLLLAASFIFLGRSAIAAQMRAFSLLPQTNQVTELYFSEPTLPSTYIPGQAQDMSFVVRNLSTDHKRYTYRVEALSERGDPVVLQAERTIELPAHASEHATISLPIPDLGDRANIRIILGNHSQVISYWVKKV